MWTQWLGPYQHHFRGIHSPDELLVDRYKDGAREWNEFVTKIKTTTYGLDNHNPTLLQEAIQKISATYKVRLDTIKDALLSSSDKKNDNHYMLGFYRAKMQEIERTMHDKQLEKEWIAHQQLDNEAIERKLYKNLAAAFQCTFPNKTDQK